MDLKRALRLSEAPRLALVGAGGKTTALFALANQFQSPVLVTTTTHLAISQLALADHYIEIQHPDYVERLGKSPLQGITLLTGPMAEQGRVSGLDLDSLDWVRTIADEWRVPLLIEADGSRMRPLKAPGDHEPAIPPFVDQVVIVAGLSGLGQPLNADWVHRPEKFATLAGIQVGEPITDAALIKVLTHPAGGLKNVPPSARRCVLFTQADSPDLQSKAYSLAQRLLPDFASVVVAAAGAIQETSSRQSLETETSSGGELRVAAVVERVAGIILAAGASLRMGQPKQLLDWQGQPFVRAVSRTAISAGLSPLIVVTGASAAEVSSAVDDLDLQIIYNPNWEAGQSTSVRTGLSVLQEEVGGAVFLLADQPQISPHLIRALVERHAATLAPVIAPQAGGRRANPVLFDRVTFQDLEKVQGDIGGRSVFSSHPIEWIEWQDESILLDVDSPEDYQRLLKSTENR